MSKVILLRIWNSGQISVLYTDSILLTGDLENIITWSQQRISQIKSMQPKGAKSQ